MAPNDDESIYLKKAQKNFFSRINKEITSYKDKNLIKKSIGKLKFFH